MGLLPCHHHGHQLCVAYRASQSHQGVGQDRLKDSTVHAVLMEFVDDEPFHHPQHERPMCEGDVLTLLESE